MNILSKLSDKLDFEEYTILVIDDNPTNLGVLVDYLETYDFEIMTALNGKEGIEMTRFGQPDIILLDIMMPGMNGFEVCNCLKADEKTKQIPIIFMTALTSTEDKVKAFVAGGVDYITKPIQQDEVLARITTHLQIRDMTRTLQEQNSRLHKMSDELLTANSVLSKRAIQLETSNQIGQHITSILNLDELLMNVVQNIQTHFGYYFVGIWYFIHDKNVIVLHSGIDAHGNSRLAEGYSISMDDENNVIVKVCDTGKAHLISNVQEADKYWYVKELPDTRSELVLPLHIGKKIIGVLDIQSNQVAAFDHEDRMLMQTLSNQIAVAIQNATLYKKEREKTHQLKILNANKNKFFSIIAHDLRNPFLPLLGLSELLEDVADQCNPTEIKTMSGHIHRSAKNVYNLLDNLLAWARMQMGRVAFDPKRFKLNEVIMSNVMLFGENAKAKGVILSANLSHDIFVHADENIIDTIVRNLTSNAIKFTPSNGMVTISAVVIPDSQHVNVTVTDTGIGVSDENIKKLFRIDAHHSTIGTNEEAGTGLGLILCKEMVEKNNGKIWMESELGKGTTVKFTVPIAP